MAKEGYDLALFARGEVALSTAVEQCLLASHDTRAEMKAFVCDVGNREVFDEQLSTALMWLGRCDVFVANAGTNRRRTAINTVLFLFCLNCKCLCF